MDVALGLKTYAHKQIWETYMREFEFPNLEFICRLKVQKKVY